MKRYRILRRGATYRVEWRWLLLPFVWMNLLPTWMFNTYDQAVQAIREDQKPKEPWVEVRNDWPSH